ncbi:proline-rich protein 2-like [Gadus morhua]|uniref:proline-rich protein 2-like n=1 Tax=Gadus morhua TaxID=8049 RepID=UPI0011B3D2BB|nr:proline-rich protein 2-like [Gadus morhua]
MVVTFMLLCLALSAAALPVTPGPETQGMEQTAQSAPPVKQAGEKAGPQVLVQILPGQQGQHPLTAANPPPEQQYLPQYHLPNQHPEPQYMPQYYLPMHHPPWFTHSGLPRGMPFQPAMQQPPFQPALQQPAMQPALQPAMQPNPQQPGPQPAHQPAVQAPLQPLLQGVPVPIQPIQQAPPPMMLNPYGYFPFYPSLQGNQQYTPYAYPMMYPAAPAAPNVQVNPPPNPAPQSPVSPGETGPPPPGAAAPNPQIVYMIHRPMVTNSAAVTNEINAQLGGLSSEELEMVAKLSNSGFFGPHFQPNMGPEARPAAATLNQAGGPQVKALEPNEAPAGFSGPRRNLVDVGPTARDPSSNSPANPPPPVQNQPSMGA